MAAMEVHSCDCESEFQDREYGKGKRMFTVGKDHKKLTCTVCGKQKK